MVPKVVGSRPTFHPNLILTLYIDLGKRSVWYVALAKFLYPAIILLPPLIVIKNVRGGLQNALQPLRI